MRIRTRSPCADFVSLFDSTGRISMAFKHRVEVVDYDPQWPVTFGRLKSVLEGRLGGLGQRIEHVGSTSVPGLAAKPIIDLDIIIESYERLPEVVARLAE